MKVSGKVWIPAGIITAVLVASLAFFSFVNPSYDEEAAPVRRPAVERQHAARCQHVHDHPGEERTDTRPAA